MIRVLAQRILQERIEAEATPHIGAEPSEHTETRTTMRNRHREKVLTTQAGDLDLAIPKVRTGSFFPSLLERRRRIDQALCRHHGGIRPGRLHPQRGRPGQGPSATTPASPLAKPRP
ncbi:transposase [Streptomyces caniscabiei]|uniref:transposase n=1 Tax=Streptomyces caniscabiei TaxID=2746961 RepID=UPI0036F1B59F